MRDEDFALFISEFGEATHRVPVPAEKVEAWRGRLPAQLLAYWREEGWCGYANGLLWTIDPEEHEDLVDEWLAGTALAQIDRFHAFARSAFGDLYLCGEKSACSVTVCCGIHAISALRKELEPKNDVQKDMSVRSFFAASYQADFDLRDEQGNPLFDRARKKLGDLAPDEMYGFEPAIVLGGKMNLDNLAKFKLDPHLTILRELGAPRLPFSKIDLDKLLPS